MIDNALSTEQLVQRDQTEAMVANGVIASISAAMSASFYAALVFWYSGNTSVWVWLALVFIVNGARFAYSRYRLKNPFTPEDTPAIILQYTSLQMIVGLVWALAAWLFLGHQDFTLATLTIVVYMGIGAGGMTHFSRHRMSIAAFTLPSLALAAALIWQAAPIFVMIGFFSLVFWYLNLRFGFEQNRQMIQALRTRYEKEDLAQQLSQQVNLAEQASKEKTRFFASASHDLRQPLHSLGLFGVSLVSRLKDTPDGVIARNMLHCVEALENSFNAMLDVSKLDAGVIEARCEPVAVADVFRRLEAAYQQQAQSEGLSLRFKPGGKWVMADAALLERLLGNLIHNAIKFTRCGGIVVIVRRRSNAQVSIEVWDSGLGMAQAEVAHIFDEFYQIGNPQRDRSQGMGMGLAIVRRLVNLMGLQLETRSEPGRGTVFKLLVPACRAPAAGSLSLTLQSPSDARSLKGKRVLVVDDEQEVRNSTAQALRLYGIEVELADGLAQACEIVRKSGELGSHGKPIHALITDLRLRAGESGMDVVAQVRQALNRALPALLVTGDTAPDRVREATQSGLRVLYKPVKMHQLVDELVLLMADQ